MPHPLRVIWRESVPTQHAPGMAPHAAIGPLSPTRPASARDTAGCRLGTKMNDCTDVHRLLPSTRLDTAPPAPSGNARTAPIAVIGGAFQPQALAAEMDEQPPSHPRRSSVSLCAKRSCLRRHPRRLLWTRTSSSAHQRAESPFPMNATRSTEGVAFLTDLGALVCRGLGDVRRRRSELPMSYQFERN